MPADRISCQYEEEARETLRKREVILVQQRRTVGRKRLEETTADGVIDKNEDSLFISIGKLATLSGARLERCVGC
jgi:hypothetical protein